MNEENLKPFQKGESRAKEAGRKGGVASGESKREKFRTLLLGELDKDAYIYIPPEKDDLGLTMIGDEGHMERAGYSKRAQLAKVLIGKALEGDLKALDMVLRLTEDVDEGQKKASESVRIA